MFLMRMSRDFDHAGTLKVIFHWLIITCHGQSVYQIEILMPFEYIVMCQNSQKSVWLR